MQTVGKRGAPCAAFALVWALAAAGAEETVLRFRVDCARDAGAIRPLHGVNNGPLNFGETVDLSERWRELAIPLARLHDSETPDPAVVDMHAVFPDPGADPEDPASYRFALTDAYIDAIAAAGAGIVYRLGESIEHRRRKNFVVPPADFQRWAAACIGVIRHYNEGWAGGARRGIRYWEIWNEPENRPAMWTGTEEEYYRLYAVAAKAIKARFPDLKVGGPSVGATGDAVAGQLRATPFLEGFAAYCRAQGAPLDFFSWHTYTNDPALYVAKAHAIRRWLDARGFAAAEVHLNEWNHLPDDDWAPLLAPAGAARENWYARLAGIEGAAFAACVLAYLQDCPVDAANLYSGDTSPFGLFSRNGVPKKSFYALKAFRALLATPCRVAAEGAAPGATAVLAGTNAARTCVNVLAANYRAGPASGAVAIDAIPWEGARYWSASRLDAERNLEPVAAGVVPGGTVALTLSMPAPCVVLVRVRSGPFDAAELPAPAPAAGLRLLPLRNVEVRDSFWAPRLRVIRENTIPHSWRYVEDEIRALARAGGEPVAGEPNGTWGEANLYKVMETCAYALALAPDATLEARLDGIIARIGAAQRPDGYVHAHVINAGKPPWDPAFLDGSHDGYVLGHMIEAALEHHAGTGKRAFLDIACRAAEQAHEHFLGPGGAPGFCGHAELEMALVELYRVVPDERYLALAKAFVERRGRGAVQPASDTPRAYFQDHAPLREQATLEGHAVRAVFFATGVADLALATGCRDYACAAERFWRSLVGRRMYVTGAIGARRAHEALGEDYELPNDGLLESCAACGLADFAQRMFLLERRAECADVLERVLYNAVLHGMALDGASTYYGNPLSDRDNPRYNAWVCCPPNLSRTILQIGRYAYAYGDAEIFVNLFVGGAARVPLAAGAVRLAVATEYPWDGAVAVTVEAAPPEAFALNLRIPGWCAAAELRLNGARLDPLPRGGDGYARLARSWRAGDRVDLALAMPVERIEAHPNVRACEGKVALQRGPLVYAFEGLDNDGAAAVVLGLDPEFACARRPDLLGGVTVVKGVTAAGRPFMAIPFYALANRGRSCQEVWAAQAGVARSSAWWLGALYRRWTPR
ncbi:MAG TPA: glycoside hydrolase family 127 protein [Planctomycetota bacterium]|jgi:hypothetical protein|nr:glycoside hydrolase family 127 protein [Planctomycetota bacterium]OQC19648.1 MAG: Non-reducing end beta-L-arabinofuranosidase [Planctomycetes bacterium ADurb.Bin069]HNR97980.1 glycoside hydrolase family 127 protein [Planctomycetota bacterium]HNU24494.1 glycoside hydrolase family 127 protein [Planctomycetota bacterium]HOE29116.1 glycoside hydrolase family 127 protein [Planctomycetota bacterium]